jgi:hypothetical protein
MADARYWKQLTTGERNSLIRIQNLISEVISGKTSIQDAASILRFDVWVLRTTDRPSGGASNGRNGSKKANSSP